MSSFKCLRMFLFCFNPWTSLYWSAVNTVSSTNLVEDARYEVAGLDVEDHVLINLQPEFHPLASETQL